jgi:hypothetical protein
MEKNAHGRKYKAPRFRAITVCLLSVLTAVRFAGANAPFPGDIETRRAWCIRHYAETKPLTQWGYAAARLEAGIEEDKALSWIDAHALSNWGTLALLQPIVTYVRFTDRLSSATVTKMKTTFGRKDYENVEFGSENMRYYTWATGYLVGQYMPDVTDPKGRKGSSLTSFCRAKMYAEFDRIVNDGFREYGCIQYLHFSYSAVYALANYAKDEEMRNRASMILDQWWYKFALQWNSGYLVTSISRTKRDSWIVHDQAKNQGHAIAAYIYFGADHPAKELGNIGNTHKGEDNSFFYLMYKGTYEPPPAAMRIARQRGPYEYTTSNFHTPSGRKRMELRRKGFVHPGFGIASQVPINHTPGWQEFIQCILRWNSAETGGTFCVVAPVMSNDKIELPVNHRVLHHKFSAAGVYNHSSKKLLGMYVDEGAVKKRIDKDGWIFCHGGSVVFGYKPVMNYSTCEQKSGDHPHPCLWNDSKRYAQRDWKVITMNHAKTGYVLETAPPSRYPVDGIEAQLNAFINEVLTKASIDKSGIDNGNPRLVYKSIHEYTLDITWDNGSGAYQKGHKVDGKVVDYPGYKMLESPWVTQAIGGKKVVAEIDGMKETLDFANWTVTDFSVNTLPIHGTVDNRFCVSGVGAQMIRIYDISGKMHRVISSKKDGVHTLTLPAGIFIVDIDDSAGHISRKILSVLRAHSKITYQFAQALLCPCQRYTP